MGKKRRQYSEDHKFNVALEAAKTTKTLGQIASKMGVHPNQISQWKGIYATRGLACSIALRSISSTVGTAGSRTV